MISRMTALVASSDADSSTIMPSPLKTVSTNFDSTATPRSFVFGSNPTMLKVDGRGRDMDRDIGLPLIPASRKT